MKWANSNKVKVTALLAVTLLLSLLNTKRAIHCGQNTGCVDSYWANFWLISYMDGYKRRAFVGQILRIFFDESVGFKTLNAIALMFVFFILLFIYYIFFAKVSKNKHWAIFFAVVVSGPTTTVFFEVLGDPLHVAFACVIAYLIFAQRVGSVYLNRFFAIVTVLFVVLIHEASIFLFLPFIYLIYSLSVKRKPEYFSLLLVVIVLALSTVFFLNNQDFNSQGLALITKDSTLIFASNDTLSSFSSLLTSELLDYFGSIYGLIKLFLKFFGVFLWPFLILVTLGHILKVKECLGIFIYLLVPSLPLYVIAHDWGRFTIYMLCMSLAVYGKISVDWDFYMPPFVRNLSENIFELTQPLFDSVAIVLVLMFIFHSHPSYRINGLTPNSIILTIVALAVFTLNISINSDNSLKQNAQNEN